MTFKHIVILGTGPVGLLSALMLSKLGIDILVLEKANEIDRRSRGASYGPSAVR